jgi:hypothetical protein
MRTAWPRVSSAGGCAQGACCFREQEQLLEEGDEIA